MANNVMLSPESGDYFNMCKLTTYPVAALLALMLNECPFTIWRGNVIGRSGPAIRQGSEAGTGVCLRSRESILD